MSATSEVELLYADAIAWIAARRPLEPTLEKLREALRLVAFAPSTAPSVNVGRLRAYLSIPDVLVDEAVLLRALALDLRERGIDCDVMVADLCDHVEDIRAHSRSFAFRGAADAVERRITEIRQCFP